MLKLSCFKVKKIDTLTKLIQFNQRTDNAIYIYKVHNIFKADKIIVNISVQQMHLKSILTFLFELTAIWVNKCATKYAIH